MMQRRRVFKNYRERQKRNVFLRFVEHSLKRCLLLNKAMLHKEAGGM